VTHAVDDYLKAYERRGGEAADKTRHTAKMHILSVLGNVPVSRLTTKRLEDWHHGLAEQSAYHPFKGRDLDPYAPRRER
jgi:hypothetical protein